jgi:hypothetical protein|tara:strand:- start:6 stop:296 length:291 start_codon:yes stop_codon:yes gene_type:complete
MAIHYCTATNTGEGFITPDDVKYTTIQGYQANIWSVGYQNTAWITRVNGVPKTHAEAQALVDANITSGQATYDAMTPEEHEAQPYITRPVAVILPT